MVSSLSIHWFLNFNDRRLGQFVLRHENDAHAPSCVHHYRPSELIPRKLPVADCNDRIAILVAIYLAAEHTTPLAPGIALRVVFELNSISKTA